MTYQEYPGTFDELIDEPAANPRRSRPQAENGAKYQGDQRHNGSDGELQFVNVAGWQAQPIPLLEWAVQDILPRGQPAILSGDGGGGKSGLIQHLAIAHVLGRDWLGMLPEPGPSLYLNCEEDERELHRRTGTILHHYGAQFTDLRDFHLLAYAGKDALLATADRNGRVQPTQLFRRLTEAAVDIRPQLIALDNSADIFGGDENNRSQVRQFVGGLLRGLAMAANACVLVSFHPSLTGINSGSGLSGSTHWHNGVKARAYLKAPEKDASGELRELQFLKNNYGRLAKRILLRWQNGLFLPVPTASPFEAMAADAQVDDVFLHILSRYTQQGRIVSDSRGPNFAPAVFEGEPEAGGIKRQAFADAMKRLFKANKIAVEEIGPPSRRRRRLIIGVGR